MGTTKITLPPFPSYRVAAIQTEPVFGDKAGNIRETLLRIEEAADRGAILVVLPELCNTGYVYSSREEAFSLAETVPDGETVKAWTKTARQRNIYIAAGLPERAGGDLFNSAVLIGPEGYIGSFRKLHLWDEEKLYFEPGNLGMPVYRTPIGRIGMLICFDGWFPELYRLAAMQGADIICVCNNWVPVKNQPEDQLTMNNLLAMGNAHCNGLNVICADRYGVERGQPFIGQSIIVGHQGWLLAGPASRDKKEILYADINIKETRTSRQWGRLTHILRDRRGDVYDILQRAESSHAPEAGFNPRPGGGAA